MARGGDRYNMVGGMPRRHDDLALVFLAKLPLIDERKRRAWKLDVMARDDGGGTA